MSYLPETSVWPEGIYQIEEDDDVRGGPLPEGIANQQAKELGDRTRFLKDKAEAIEKRLKTLEGVGGPLDAFDFEEATPSAEDLTRYACENIWGSGGVFSWNAAAPWNSTYAVGGVTRKAEEIFSATWVNNLFNKHRFVLVNTPDTDPSIFSWEDVGQDMAAVADDETAGLVKGGGDIIINENGEMFIKNTVDVGGGSREAMYNRSAARNLLDVLGIRGTHSDAPATIEELLEFKAILKGKINADGESDFSGLRYCDYIDLPFLNDGTENIQWEGSYKNLRFMIIGFNSYKHTGSTEITKNHIVFQSVDCPIKRRMNATNTNTGGWKDTELKTYLDGAFKTALEALFGGDFILQVSRLLSTKNSNTWVSCSVFIPTEHEITNAPVYSETDHDAGCGVRFPVYSESSVWLVKRNNGARTWYWEASPHKDSTSNFTRVYSNGIVNDYYTASSVGGVAPAFCVA